MKKNKLELKRVRAKNKDGRRKYTIDDSVILIMQNSSIKCSQIDITNIKLNKSTLYRYLKGDLKLILHTSAIKLAKFYGYEPIFRNKMFFFGNKIMTEPRTTLYKVDYYKNEIKELKKSLKEQKFCYELAASRAKRYKSQLNIIKEALNMEVIC